MKFKKVSPIAWEGVRKPYDFHVRVEDGEFVVDAFRQDIKVPNEAYLASERFETWEEVEEYCDTAPTITIEFPTKH